MNFSLSKLYPLINIDGTKLAVDIPSYSIFMWNDYAERGSIWNGINYISCWVVFRNMKKSIFIKFLKGELSFLSLFNNEKRELAFLKNDYDTIVIDDNFKFEVALPDEDSALDDEALTLIPENQCSFGSNEHFYRYDGFLKSIYTINIKI